MMVNTDFKIQGYFFVDLRGRPRGRRSGGEAEQDSDTRVIGKTGADSILRALLFSRDCHWYRVSALLSTYVD